jgi:hypothetical protein
VYNIKTLYRSRARPGPRADELFAGRLAPKGAGVAIERAGTAGGPAARIAASRAVLAGLKPRHAHKPTTS